MKPPKKTSNVSPLMSDAITEWFTHIQGLSGDTQRLYKRVLLNFSAPMGRKPVDKLRPADIRNYIRQISPCKKKSSISTEIAAIKAFCRFLAERYDIDNPASEIPKFKTELTQPRFISHEDYDKILKAATLKEADVIQFIANGGFRPGELCSLSWECVSPDGNTITLIGRGGRKRSIPVNQTMREIIARHRLRPRERFLNLPKNRRDIHQRCDRAGSRVGIHLNPDMLRRFFGRSLYENGVRLIEISRRLGIGSLDETVIYLHLDPPAAFERALRSKRGAYRVLDSSR